jgi:rRNA-processing protein FCF1
MLKINLTHPNPALISIIENPEQIITLDANFLIAPDRRPITKRGIGFEQFNEIWLDPIFSVFPNLAIHESVYDELVGISPQNNVRARHRFTQVVSDEAIFLCRQCALEFAFAFYKSPLSSKTALRNS